MTSSAVTGKVKLSRLVAGLGLGGLGGPFWILCVGTFINRLGTMVVPFMTLYLVSGRGLSAANAGEVVAGFGAGALIAPLVGGALADRVGRRVTLLGATLVSAGIMITLATVREIAIVVVLVACLGMALEAPRPVSQALVADIVDDEDRTRAYAVLFWVTNLGFAAAMASAGFIAEAGFASLFLIDGLTGVLYGVLVWFAFPEMANHPTASIDRADGYRRVLRDRTMLGFVLAVALYYFVYLQSDATLSLAIHRSGLPPSTYGLCMALNGALICFVQPLLAPHLARRDPGRVWATGVVLVGVGFALTAVASSTLSYLGSVATWSTGEIFPATVSGAIVARLAPQHLRGRYSGLYGLALSSGWLTAALGGTKLLSISSTLLWATCGLLCVVSAAFVQVIASRLR